MSLSDLISHATDKERFRTIENYIEFCVRYLEYVETGLQCVSCRRMKAIINFFSIDRTEVSTLPDR